MVRDFWFVIIRHRHSPTYLLLLIRPTTNRLRPLWNRVSDATGKTVTVTGFATTTASIDGDLPTTIHRRWRLKYIWRFVTKYLTNLMEIFVSIGWRKIHLSAAEISIFADRWTSCIYCGNVGIFCGGENNFEVARFYPSAYAIVSLFISHHLLAL